MVALMLLSVVSLILSGLIPATITGMAKAAQRTNAQILAQNELAIIAQAGFGHLSPSAPPHKTLEVSGTSYLLKVLVEPTTLADGSPMDETLAKLVSVEVTWRYQNSDQKVVERQVFIKRV